MLLGGPSFLTITDVIARINYYSLLSFLLSGHKAHLADLSFLFVLYKANKVRHNIRDSQETIMCIDVQSLSIFYC